LNDTEAREIGDGAADELRTRLEQKYAPKLLAIVSKAPETDKKYKSTWDEYVAYVKDAGVSPVPPRSAFVASYLDHLVSQGAPEAKIKLVRAAIIERSLARRGEDYPFRIRPLTYH